MFKIALYEIKKLYRNKRWLLIFALQPIILITLLVYTLHCEPTGVKFAVYQKTNSPSSNLLVRDLQKEDRLKVEVVSSEDDLISKIKHDEVEGAVIIDLQEENGGTSGSLVFYNNITRPDISNTAKNLALESINTDLQQFAEQNVNNQFGQLVKKSSVDFGSRIDVQSRDNSIKDNKFIDYFASSAIMLLIILLSLYTSATTITHERESGTLERFFVTPYSKIKLVLGKMMAHSLVSIFLSLIMIATLRFVFDVDLGSVWLVLLVAYITSITAVALGILISTLTHSVAESIQVSIFSFYSTLILAGFVYQPEGMHKSIRFISSIIPFTYAIKSAREVSLLNLNIFDISNNLFILLGYSVLFLLLAILFLNRKSN